jgi:acrylyl-CoA reductase (NADPH)
MTEKFNAIIAEDQDGMVRGRLKQITIPDLPEEDVLVEVTYSTINYKDGLAVTGTRPICQKLPMVCGIDLAGTVLETKDDRFKVGDRVLVNGYGLSERHWGGYSRYAKVRPEFLVPIPDAFLPEEAMAIGTAGYTAMLCVQALTEHGITHESGPVLVTGASGGVGTIAIMLLARLGFEVVAASGRAAENETFLKDLGATRVQDRNSLAGDPAPLDKERWAGVVDCVGGNVLANSIAQTRYEGLVAACGLAGGVAIPTTVMPFILRGVTLRGIDSVQASMERRKRAWTALADLIDKHKLREDYRVEPLTRVPELAAAILRGEIRGRVVIDVNE